MGDEVRYTKRTYGKNSMRFLIFVLILLVGVVSVQVSRLYKKNTELEKEASALEIQVQHELTEQEELIEYKNYMLTDDYIENVARDKFGLIKPGDTLFIQNSKD